MSEDILANSPTQAVTRNYADDRRMYYYRVTDDARLEQRIGSGEWGIAFSSQGADRVNKRWLKTVAEAEVLGPIARVAADSNRVFIMTADHRLYWRCLYEDSASWVLLVFTLAQVLGYGYEASSEASDEAWRLIDGVPNFREWLGADSSPGELADKLIWSLVGEEMMHVEGFSFYETNLGDWAGTYREWALQTHKPENGWNPLSERTWLLGSGTEVSHEEFLDGTETTDSHQILGIAVGNWHGTVITYYALTRSSAGRRRIFYLDEETLMHSWKEVPGQEAIALDDNSMICASHSVIGTTGPGRDSVDSRKIYWLRFDAHTNEHIPFWPLNWTEEWVDVNLPPEVVQTFPDGFDVSGPSDMGPWSDLVRQCPPLDVFDVQNYPGWHEADAPAKQIVQFRIDASCGTLPWPIPKPHVVGELFSPIGLMQVGASAAWKVYILLAVISAVIDTVRGNRPSEIGVLGENPVKPNYNYPVCCIIQYEAGFKGFAIRTSVDVIEWVEIDESTATADTWLCRTVTRWIDVLHRSTRTAWECTEDASRRRWVCTAWECPSPVPEVLCDLAKAVCVFGTWVLETVCRWVVELVEWTERVLIRVTGCTNPCREAALGGGGPTPDGKAAEGVKPWKKATTFLEALVLAKKVPASVARKRVEICQACTFLRHGRCSLCGCSVRTRLPVASLATYEENLPKWGCKHPRRSQGQGWPALIAGASDEAGPQTSIT